MSFIFGKTVLDFSITNSIIDKKDALDLKQPFSFFDFLKYSASLGSPLEYNDGYNQYLQQWYSIKNNSDEVIINGVRDRYIDLLKDITLNYTTSDEKRFLSNIDFNDPKDLDIAIPFYSKKIREICNFICKKREHVKHKIEHAKIKGTEKSVDKLIFEIINDFVGANNLTISSNISSIDIEVEELYDLYTNYFDIDPSKKSEDYNVLTPIRSEFFTSNTNTIDEDLFINFDQQLKGQIFNIPVFLNELGKVFTINYNLDNVNLTCNTGDKLFTLVQAASASANTLLDLKKQLIEKFIGTDFYYLSTNSTLTDVTSGILFEAKNPTGNLINRHFPSTATVDEKNNLQSLRDIGLFFTPDKTGILYYSAADFSFRIQKEKLEANKLYIFPDPTRYGKTSGITNEVYDTPLVFTIDCTNSVYNFSHGFAFGDIKNVSNTQDFFPYKSQNDSTYNLQGIEEGFSSIYGSGVISHWKSDIFGNEYCLFKPKTKKKIDDGINLGSKITLICGDFTNLDYTTIGWDSNGTLHTGLTITCGGSNVSLYVSDFNEGLSLDFSTSDIVNTGCQIKEAGYFTSEDGTILPDPTSGDSLSWDSDTGFFYYTTLIDCAVAETDISQRATTDSLSANFLVQNLKSTILDGSRFDTTICQLVDDNEVKIPFIDKNYNGTTSFANTDTTSLDISGTIYVKDILTNTVAPASDSLNIIFDKYSDSVKAELYNNVKDISVYYDSIFVETDNYFVIDRINQTNISKNIVFDNSVPNTKVSKPFFFEDKNYCMFTILSANTDNQAVIPFVYTFNFENNDVELVFPLGDPNRSELTTLFSTASTDVVSVKSPIFTYNSRNDKYAIIYTTINSSNIPTVNLNTFRHTTEGIVFENLNSYVINSTNNTDEPTNTFVYELSGSDNPAINVNGMTEITYDFSTLNAIKVDIDFGDNSSKCTTIDGSFVTTINHIYKPSINEMECVIEITYSDFSVEQIVIPISVNRLSFTKQFGTLDIVGAQFTKYGDLFITYKDSFGNLYNNLLLQQ